MPVCAQGKPLSEIRTRRGVKFASLGTEYAIGFKAVNRWVLIAGRKEAGVITAAQFRNNSQGHESDSHALGKMVNSELSQDPDARLLRVVDCPCCIPKSVLLCGDHLLRVPGFLSING